MALHALLVTYQSLNVPCKVEGAQRESVGIHNLHSIAPENGQRLLLNFPAAAVPHAAFSHTTILLPEHIARRVMAFAAKHLAAGPGGYDCASFIRFILSWGPSEINDDIYHPDSHETSVADLKPYTPYIFTRGAVKKHIVLTIPGGYCLSVFGEDASLIVARTPELMEAYGTPTAHELVAVTA